MIRKVGSRTIEELSVQEVISILKLQPLAGEGGYFIQTHQATEAILQEQLPGRYSGGRPFYTAIYYLITPESFSSMHRLKSDEIWHFYLGDPVEQLQISPDGNITIIKIGAEITQGFLPQVLVPRGAWQGTKLLAGGKFALLGTTVSPGFACTDYEQGRRNELIARYPQVKALIDSFINDCI